MGKSIKSLIKALIIFALFFSLPISYSSQSVAAAEGAIQFESSVSLNQNQNYEYIGRFDANGLATTELKGLKGLVDRNMKEVVSPKYNYITEMTYEPNYNLYKLEKSQLNDDMYTYSVDVVDHTGKIILQNIDWIEDFNEYDFAKFALTIDKKQYTGILKTDGTLLAKPEFSYIEIDQSNELIYANYYVTVGTSSMYSTKLYNFAGALVFPTENMLLENQHVMIGKYDSYSSSMQYTQIVGNNWYRGYIRKNGEILQEAKYYDTRPLPNSDSLYLGYSNQKSSLLRKEGDKFIELKNSTFNWINMLNERYASVSVNQKTGIYDVLNEKVIIPPDTYQYFNIIWQNADTVVLFARVSEMGNLLKITNGVVSTLLKDIRWISPMNIEGMSDQYFMVHKTSSTAVFDMINYTVSRDFQYVYQSQNKDIVVARELDQTYSLYDLQFNQILLDLKEPIQMHYKVNDKYDCIQTLVNNQKKYYLYEFMPSSPTSSTTAADRIIQLPEFQYCPWFGNGDGITVSGKGLFDPKSDKPLLLSVSSSDFIEYYAGNSYAIVHTKQGENYTRSVYSVNERNTETGLAKKIIDNLHNYRKLGEYHEFYESSAPQTPKIYKLIDNKLTHIQVLDEEFVGKTEVIVSNLSTPNVVSTLDNDRFKDRKLRILSLDGTPLVEETGTIREITEFNSLNQAMAKVNVSGNWVYDMVVLEQDQNGAYYLRRTGDYLPNFTPASSSDVATKSDVVDVYNAYYSQIVSLYGSSFFFKHYPNFYAYDFSSNDVRSIKYLDGVTMMNSFSGKGFSNVQMSDGQHIILPDGSDALNGPISFLQEVPGFPNLYRVKTETSNFFWNSETKERSDSFSYYYQTLVDNNNIAFGFNGTQSCDSDGRNCQFSNQDVSLFQWYNRGQFYDISGDVLNDNAINVSQVNTTLFNNLYRVTIVDTNGNETYDIFEIKNGIAKKLNTKTLYSVFAEDDYIAYSTDPAKEFKKFGFIKFNNKGELTFTEGDISNSNRLRFTNGIMELYSSTSRGLLSINNQGNFSIIMTGHNMSSGNMATIKDKPVFFYRNFCFDNDTACDSTQTEVIAVYLNSNNDLISISLPDNKIQMQSEFSGSYISYWKRNSDQSNSHGVLRLNKDANAWTYSEVLNNLKYSISEWDTINQDGILLSRQHYSENTKTIARTVMLDTQTGEDIALKIKQFALANEVDHAYGIDIRQINNQDAYIASFFGSESSKESWCLNSQHIECQISISAIFNKKGEKISDYFRGFDTTADFFGNYNVYDYYRINDEIQYFTNDEGTYVETRAGYMRHNTLSKKYDWIAQPVYDWLDKLTKNGLAVASCKLDNNYYSGLIGQTGVIIPCEERVSNISVNFRDRKYNVVIKNDSTSERNIDKYNAIDAKGNLLFQKIENQMQYVDKIRINKDSISYATENNWVLTDLDQKQITSFNYSGSSQIYGLEQLGQLLISYGEVNYYRNRDIPMGLLSMSGQEILPPIYKDITYSDGLYYITDRSDNTFIYKESEAIAGKYEIDVDDTIIDISEYVDGIAVAKIPLSSSSSPFIMDMIFTRVRAAEVQYEYVIIDKDKNVIKSLGSSYDFVTLLGEGKVMVKEGNNVKFGALNLEQTNTGGETNTGGGSGGSSGGGSSGGGGGGGAPAAPATPTVPVTPTVEAVKNSISTLPNVSTGLQLSNEDKVNITNTVNQIISLSADDKKKMDTSSIEKLESLVKLMYPSSSSNVINQSTLSSVRATGLALALGIDEISQNNGNVSVGLEVKKATLTTTQEKSLLSQVDPTGALGSKLLPLDLSIVKTVGGVNSNITETKVPIQVTITLPAGFDPKGSYVIAREHNGIIEMLETMNNGDGTISFKSDKFSTYVLVHNNSEAKGTDLGYYSNGKFNIYANSRVVYVSEGKDTIYMKGYAFEQFNNFSRKDSFVRELIFLDKNDPSNPNKAYRITLPSVYDPYLNKNKNLNPNGTYNYNYAYYGGWMNLNKVRKYTNPASAPLVSLPKGEYLIYIRMSDGKRSNIMSIKSTKAEVKLPSSFSLVPGTSDVLFTRK